MATSSARKSPAIGTLNTHCMMPIRPTAISMEMHRYGVSLPSISPQRDSGLTINCSRVPRSRSRTSDMAVANMVAICRTRPITPGTKKFGLRISGL